MTRVLVAALVFVLLAAGLPAAASTSSAGTNGHRAARCVLKWRVVKAAIPPSGSLAAVVAVSRTSAWAVGQRGTLAARTLTERWNGRRWAVTPSPNVGRKENVLYGLAVLSGTDAWAVGHTTVLDRQSRTLIEHWDGARWRVVPSANMNARHSELFDAVAVSENDVWAVGGSDRGDNWEFLIEHWDGHRWSLVPSAIRGGILFSLAQFPLAQFPGVDLFAVGSQDVQDGAVMQHWDGFKWTVVAATTPEGYLYDVSGTSGDDLWAVGADGAGPLVEHWDGVEWAVDEIPFRHFSSRYNKRLDSELNGVFAVSPTNVWAVGFGIEHWNGNRWALIELEKDAGLYAIDGSTARDIWAVGESVKHYSCK
jgi:hypothetical protein